MLLKDYEKLLASPKKAEKLFLKYCWPNYQRFCPKCKSRKLKKIPLTPAKRKCLRCEFVFDDFSGRYLSYVHLTPEDWLRLIKLFEVEVEPLHMVTQLNLSYNTIRKALTVIRLAILANSLDGPEIVYQFSLNKILSSHSKIHLKEVPILGVVEEQGHIFIDFLPEFGLESFIHLKLNFCLPSKKVGHIIYTAPMKKYLSLILYDQQVSRKYNLTHKGKNIPLDGNKSFWPFVKKRLRYFRTTNSLNFLLYFKELEFRYNFRQKDFFLNLVKYLTSFVLDSKS